MPMTATTTQAAATTHSPVDAGLDYGERSVRLPLGYDPRDNWGGPGPIINCPAAPPPRECGYGCFGGFGGYGCSDYTYGLGYGTSRYGGCAYTPYSHFPGYSAWSGWRR